MQRLLPSGALTALVVIVAGASACTLYPGRGWGEADVTLSARFAPDETRLTDDGRLRTSRDYAVAITDMRLDVEAVELVVESELGDDALGFDPAAPPPGYSLCHGGHCHADDGRLVDYADIEAELSGAAASAYTAVLSAGDEVALGDDAAPIETRECSAGCILPRGQLAIVRARLASLVLAGTVFDLRTGDQVRLPADGVPFAGALALDVLPVELRTELVLDGSQPPGIALGVVIDLPPSLFDGVGLAFYVESNALDLNTAGGLLAAEIIANLRDDTTLEVTAERFDVRPDAEPVLFPQQGNSTGR